MHKQITRLLFLFLFLSFMLDFGLGTGLTNIKGLSLKNIAIYLMIIFLVAGSILQRKKLIQPNIINKPILFFIGYCFLSLSFTYIFSYAGRGSFLSKLIDFKSFIDPFILAIIAYSLVDDIKTAKFLISSLLVLFFAFNFITILSSFGIATFKGVEFNLKYGRTEGAFAEPNQYAAYVSLFIPICIAAFFHFKSVLRKAVITLLLFAGIYCVLLTGSRGGLLSMVIGLAALNVLSAKKKSAFLIFQTIGGLLIICVLIVVTFSFLPEISKSGIQGNIIERAMEQDLNQYSSGRLQGWARGLKLFIYNPIFGAGYGTYTYKAGPSNSHNDYLLYLATTGIVGFYLFGRIFYRLFRTVNSYKNVGGDNNWYYNGYLAGFISFCVSMFFVNIMQPYYFFFIFSALILKIGFLEINGIEFSTVKDSRELAYS